MGEVELKVHDDGSMTLNNAAVQRLMDYGLLHYIDGGWLLSNKWPTTNTRQALKDTD